MRFLDEAKIYIKAGDGGDGCLSFRREKFIEFGGPDGGSGGHGGSIYALAVNNVNTLIDYRYKQHFKAKKGNHGEGQNKTGKSGTDIILKVPIGTQILDEDKFTEIADLLEEGQVVLLAEGGRGGAGNAAFKSSTNQSPRKTTPGTEGEEKWIWLKLKLIADIAIVGMPNAGKSTFISAVTNLKAKIEDYPFSTITPQLGMVSFNDKEIIIADIPGLIENAHLGKGLGDRFLAHVERCSVILHIIDASQDDPVSNYITIRKELELYGNIIYDKPEIIVLNKSDVTEETKIERIKKKLKAQTKLEIFTISAVMNSGCKEVINYASKFVNCKNDKW
ncbi:MAG: GTPase ObgE [Holosporales bacterium]|jgi:GTP-binding protein|nr:GTPase ObgE [Holosporales bacterium]